MRYILIAYFQCVIYTATRWTLLDRILLVGLDIEAPLQEAVNCAQAPVRQEARASYTIEHCGCDGTCGASLCATIHWNIILCEWQIAEFAKSGEV